jgi:hypothetical protein
LTQIIRSDLVTLLERGTYNGIFGLYVYPLLAWHNLSHDGSLSASAFGGRSASWWCVGTPCYMALAFLCVPKRCFASVSSHSYIDLNIPIAGLAFVLLMVFLTLPTPPGGIRDKFTIDWMYVLFL